MVKKRSFLKKSKQKKNPIPSHTEKSFTISILKKKKSPTTTTYWLLVILPNSTLSVFNNKQKHPTKNQQTYKKQQKNTFYLIQFVFLDIIQQFRIYNLLFHKCSPLFSTILLKKSNVLTKT